MTENKMNNIKAVIFDCDGVMFDTADLNRHYYNQILNHFGYNDMTDKQFSFVHAHTVDNSISYLFKDKNVDFKDIELYRQNMDYKYYLKFMKFEENLIELLCFLKPDYKTAIATNRSNSMSIVLDEFKLNEYFDIVVTSSDVNNPKPYPDQLIKIINFFKLKPEQVLYIGDSNVDESASQKANVNFVAYKNKNLKANYHIDNLIQLITILNS